KNFFRPSLNDLHDPFLMQDMQKAVDRIQQAIKEKQKILVFGDYDVDGTSSVALVSSFLKKQTSNTVLTYIPDRYSEGYGISLKSIDFAASNNVKLIIALDCGIQALDQVEHAREKNIDFIICDHHTPSKEIPKAIAVLNPLREDCKYPFKELCGCGIGFKLIQGLNLVMENTIEDIKEYLDLVGLAIVADIVALTGENRILCYYGLEQINESPRAGLKAIIDTLEKDIITINELGFYLGPRINAAGRMESGNLAVELLVEENLEKAIGLAEKLNQLNIERRILDKETTQEAISEIKKHKNEKSSTTVVCNPDWHRGVIGIAASKLIEAYYRPTIVFTSSNNFFVGSARSVNGYNVHAAIEKCKEFIVEFGGHKYAAGIKIKKTQYKDFKAKFEEVVSSTIDKSMTSKKVAVEGEIVLEEITPKFYRILKQFAPFGPGNKTPIFSAKNLRDTGYAKVVGKDNTHLKFNLTQQNSSKIYNAIGFGLSGKYPNILNKKIFNAAFTVDENYWNGKENIQLKVIDIKN
ncbi:MAG TPA: single-stranded-DNA-specific exonuclease RecJ, partial [Flavobacteriaceae bacterium]|nr:single-stranded-DNA-specific exonuclease RecJ [Flavobacteriaceae bacterium]